MRCEKIITDALTFWKLRGNAYEQPTPAQIMDVAKTEVDMMKVEAMNGIYTELKRFNDHIESGHLTIHSLNFK